jgi:putative sterol carrier protein
VQPADVFALVVRKSSADRIERVMRTPVRRLVLNGIFWQMPRHLDRERAKEMNASIRWCITGRSDGETDVYQLDFIDGRCRVTRSPNGPEPRLTITLDAVELIRLAVGQSDPTRAYFGGRVALSGDVMLAAKLGSLFRIPTGRT